MKKPIELDDIRDDDLEDPNYILERAYIEEYLHTDEFTQKTLKKLPKDCRRRLMVMASLYASCKLADIEAKGKAFCDLHEPSEISSGIPVKV